MNPDEKAIRDVVALWHRATALGDIEAILPLMTDDAVFLVAGRPPMKGRDAFEKQLRQVLASQRITSSAEVQEVRVSGDLAYCWSMLKVDMEPQGGGELLRRSGHTLTIFSKTEDGRWLLTRDANMLSAP